VARDRIAFLADGHLTVDDDARVDGLVRVLDGLSERCSAVYILGDLFEVWLGLDKPDPAVARVGEAFKRLRAAGVRTVYVEGNRDFAIGRGAPHGYFDVIAGCEQVETFGETTFHLSHGDLVNPRDYQYRWWRRVSKRVLAPAALAVLPDAWSQSLAARLETALRTTNRRHKSYFPRDACVAHAAVQVERGVDVVVVGHFHRHEVIPIESGGRHGRFVSLPFWHEQAQPVFFDAQGNMSL